MKRQISQSISSERSIHGGREIELTYRTGDGDPVPAILLLPGSVSRVPGCLLLHGYSSRKEVMAHAIGRTLFERGIASLAIDLPLHGTRADPVQAQASRNPLAMMKLWRHGLLDARIGVKFLAARKEIDAARVAVAGYSMGAFMAVTLAADEPALRCVVLAAGGDLPADTPFAAAARMVADPARSAARLSGRPLLMIHGRSDRTVPPAQAQRLFDAAHEPKQIIWYDAGHYLPHEASVDAAEWLRQRLE